MLTETRPPQAERRSQPDKVFVGFLPGLSTAPRDLQELRKYLHNKHGENAFTTPPLSVWNQPYSPFDWLANEYKTRAKDADELRLVGHSLGAFEMLDVADSLLRKRLAVPTLSLNFLATHGFRERGLRNAINFAQRVYEFQKVWPIKDQHYTYPIPENYYEGQEELLLPLGMEVIFQDSSLDRAERRNIFREMHLPNIKGRIGIGNTDTRIEDKVDELDYQIDCAVSEDGAQSQEVDRLVAKRGETIQPYIDAMYHGFQYPSSRYKEVNRRYEDIDRNFTPGFKKSLIYSYEHGYIFGDLQTRVRTIQAQAKRQGIDLKLAMTFLEHDQMAKPEDIPFILVNLNAAGIRLETCDFVEQSAHSTPGYAPRIIDPIL